jgi:Tol biopolymer transport system component
MLPGGASPGTARFYDWSPSGDRFAYMEISFNTPISIVTRAGTVTKIQAAPPGEQLFFRFSWSPDGTRLLYLATAGFNFTQPFVINADGSGRTAVGPPGTYSERSLAWSPDGRRVAFAGDLPGPPLESGTWLADPDGSNRVRLTTNASGSVVFSPDGLLLAGTIGGHLLIYSINDGAVRQTIPPPDGQITNLRWSPDGRYFAGAKFRSPSVWDVAVMRTDGTGSIRIDAFQDTPVEPQWSRDSRRLVFTKQTMGNSNEVFFREVHVVKSDGTGLIRVTTNGTEERFPRWVP